MITLRHSLSLWLCTSIGVGSLSGLSAAALWGWRGASTTARGTDVASLQDARSHESSRTSGPKQNPDVSPSAGFICPGGMISELGLEITPRFINSDFGEQGLSLLVRFSDRFSEKGPFAMRYAVEIRDDSGAELEPAQIHPILQMENAASKEFAVELPETGDGYYRCTITAVASKKAASSETESTFYWRVADGIQEPLEFRASRIPATRRHLVRQALSTSKRIRQELSAAATAAGFH